MAALTQDADTKSRDGVDFDFPVAAGAWIHAGAVVALNSTGFAVPGTAATGLQSVGVAQAGADNRTGVDGRQYVSVRRGVFLLGASGTIGRADIGKPCYIMDDNTVTLSATDKSFAGIIRDVGNGGVWVEF
ncbi:MAG: hypothetical protein LBU53_07250 [Zoogloeaceae bacterium]|jgi:hypothetical protein|nr:hypothetical protein [Zoogloeaceae bacterium]